MNLEIYFYVNPISWKSTKLESETEFVKCLQIKFTISLNSNWNHLFFKNESVYKPERQLFVEEESLAGEIHHGGDKQRVGLDSCLEVNLNVFLLKL